MARSQVSPGARRCSGRLSRIVTGISPFSHIAKLPGALVMIAPLIWLTAVAVTLTAAGLAGFRRRDLL